MLTITKPVLDKAQEIDIDPEFIEEVKNTIGYDYTIPLKRDLVLRKLQENGINAFSVNSVERYKSQQITRSKIKHVIPLMSHFLWLTPLLLGVVYGIYLSIISQSYGLTVFAGVISLFLGLVHIFCFIEITSDLKYFTWKSYSIKGGYSKAVPQFATQTAMDIAKIYPDSILQIEELVFDTEQKIADKKAHLAQIQQLQRLKEVERQIRAAEAERRRKLDPFLKVTIDNHIFYVEVWGEPNYNRVRE